MKQDLINHDMLDKTLRFCPRCDPLAIIPIESRPRGCTCGYQLIVWTPVSGKVEDCGQYKGERDRYAFPIAVTTGMTLQQALGITDDDDDAIPF